MQTKVILIGKNPSIILGQTRDLGRCGYEIHLIKTNSLFSFEIKCRYIKSAIKAKEIKVSICDYLIDTFGENGKKNVILPADDSGTIIIDQNISRLSKYFVFPNIKNTEGSMELSMDKFLQKQIAIRSGFNVAKGAKIEVKENEYLIPEQMTFPCFVKPCGFDVQRKSTMFRCDSKQDLLNRLSKIKDKQVLLSEEFVKIDREWGVLGINTSKGLVIAGLTEKHILDKGVTAIGISHYLSPSDELYINIRQFMDQLGYQGFFGLDLLESDGKFYFCEVNFRLPNFGVSYLKYGFHLTGYLVSSLLKEDTKIEIPKFDVFKFADERVLYRKYQRNDITLRQAFRYMKEVDFRILKDNDDGEPYKAFVKSVLKPIAKKTIKQLFKKSN